MSTIGRVTLPIEENIDQQLLTLIELWKADAIRNSDGTRLSKALSSKVEKVYATFFPVRQDIEYTRAHPESLQQMYLMSEPRHAEGSTLCIDILSGYFDQQLKIVTERDPKDWWEVIDRSSGEIVPGERWSFDATTGTVTIHGCHPFHRYTVSFLCWQTWDPTQMYNHLVNNWGDDVPHAQPYNPVQPETRRRMMDYFESWLLENKDPNVIRFTTFFYHFTLVYGADRREKFMDWFGYGQSVSADMLLLFEQHKGYRPRPEVFVDAGYYNSSFRAPSAEYMEYIDFVQRFVADAAREMVEICHKHQREAMMFLGDNYIGTEPYGKYFADIGLDAVVGSVDCGAGLRMIADIPGVKYREGRFLPYFFPDTFHEGGDPVTPLNRFWMDSRRAMMRNPVDRIGFGGYPSLALKFPDFVQRAAEICDEFRALYDNIGGSKPYTPRFKIGILSAWGSLRRWQLFMSKHTYVFKQTQIYAGILESLSGMAVDVVFLSFEDVTRGVPEGVDVLLNAGPEGTAFSGGALWKDPALTSAVRAFVARGGALIGIGEPSACANQDLFFQLADVLGVEKERSLSLSYDKYPSAPIPHFITADAPDAWDFGACVDDVYAKTAQNLVVSEAGCTRVACQSFGNGRAVYIAGLPISHASARLLMRSIFWAAGQEEQLYRWFSENPATECSAYPDAGRFAVLNNTDVPQNTRVHKGDGTSFALELEPMQICWFDM